MDVVFIVFSWIILSLMIGVWARNKGLSGIAAFIISLFFSPLIGIISTATSKPNEKKLAARSIKSGEMKKCPACAELVKAEAVKCRFCGEVLIDIDPAPVQTEKSSPTNNTFM